MLLIQGIAGKCMSMARGQVINKKINKNKNVFVWYNMDVNKY